MSDHKDEGWVNLRDVRRIELLADYLRQRISPESKVEHLMPMARECWRYIHSEDEVQ